MRWNLACGVVGLGAAWAGLGGWSGPGSISRGGQGGAQAIPPDPRPVFQAHCVGCHTGANAAAGLDLSGDLTALASLRAVRHGQPHASTLFKVVDNGSMPKNGTKLAPNEINTIRDWIMSLRPDPRALFTAKCVGCHGAAHPAAGMDLSGDLTALTALPESNFSGGDATTAVLYKRVADGSMPKGGTKLTDSELVLVRDWLNSAHPDPGPIFKTQCASCHSGATAAAGLDLSGGLDAVAATRAVRKGKPYASGLYRRVANGSMPKGGTPLTDSQTGIIWDWIASLKE